MSFLKNKHMLLAMFVAPILAITAYIATDYTVSEKPQQATQGSSYPLSAGSNCRYRSGACTLKNGDIKIQLTPKRLSEELVLLTLESNQNIKNAVIAVVQSGKENPPLTLQSLLNSESEFTTQLNLKDTENTTIRLAVIIDASTYFVETTTKFMDYDTGFSRGNFSD